MRLASPFQHRIPFHKIAEEHKHCACKRPPDARGLCDPACLAPGFIAALGLVACVLIIAVLALLPASCTSSEEAQSQADVAKARVTELRAQETKEQAAGHAAAAAAIAANRVKLEAAAAAVTAELAAQNKPDPTEKATTDAAGMIPGGIGALGGSVVALGFHLWRSKRLTGLVNELKLALDGSQTTSTELVNSIEDAKTEDPAFAMAFNDVAPIIASAQSVATTMHVDRIQKARQHKLPRGPYQRPQAMSADQAAIAARNAARIAAVHPELKIDAAPTPAVTSA